jgi:hypothetical protein
MTGNDRKMTVLLYDEYQSFELRGSRFLSVLSFVIEVLW